MVKNNLEKLKLISKRIYFKTILFLRRLKKRFFFITFKKFTPKIHVNEQYEKLVKWILRIFTIIGIFSSIFAFSEWYFNLALALLLVCLEQFLERAVFTYFTFYLSAIPEYKPEDWKGMMWVHSEDTSNKYFEVGMFFSSREAAERIFSTIEVWSKDGNDDKNNMVQVSVIINRLDYYHVYIYPNVDLDPNYLAVKEKREAEQPGKEHIMEFISIMLCKGFDYSTSTFPRFQKFYKDGDDYILCAYVIENNEPVRLSYLGCIKKNALKIKMETDLTQKDREYEHSKFLIDFNKYKEEKVEPSRSYIAWSKK